MANSVKLLLKEGTQVPRWMVERGLNFLLDTERRNGRELRWLQIFNAQAYFMPDGGVAVGIVGSDRLLMAFDPMTVMQIYDSNGRIIEQNHQFCDADTCIDLTGRQIGADMKSNRNGRSKRTYKCDRCGKQWKREI